MVPEGTPIGGKNLFSLYSHSVRFDAGPASELFPQEIVGPSRSCTVSSLGTDPARVDFIKEG